MGRRDVSGSWSLRTSTGGSSWPVSGRLRRAARWGSAARPDTGGRPSGAAFPRPCGGGLSIVSLLVAAGAAAYSHTARARPWGAGDRSSAGPGALDGLAGAEAQRAATRPGHLRRRPGARPRSGATHVANAPASSCATVRCVRWCSRSWSWSGARSRSPPGFGTSTPIDRGGICVTRPSTKPSTAAGKGA